MAWFLLIQPCKDVHVRMSVHMSVRARGFGSLYYSIFFKGGIKYALSEFRVVFLLQNPTECSDSAQTSLYIIMLD